MFFQQLDKNCDMQQHTQTNSNKLDKSEDDYISQFICLANELDESQFAQEIVSQNFSNSESEMEKKKRSQFHNFQKHLITTVKRIVKPTFKEMSLPQIRAAEQIWRVFKEVKKYTKEFLSAITNNRVQRRILEKYGLVKILEKYGQEVFNQAQEYLKKQIISTFQAKKSGDFLYDRRIEKKEEFSEYLETTMQQLREGVINKRLMKVTPQTEC